jgi:hypothetical protein
LERNPASWAATPAVWNDRRKMGGIRELEAASKGHAPEKLHRLR